MLNDFIEAVVGSEDETTAHSLKSTTLVWAARVGAPHYQGEFFGVLQQGLVGEASPRSLWYAPQHPASEVQSWATFGVRPVETVKRFLVKVFEVARWWKSQPVQSAVFLHLWL